ncbi:hypothetical protein HKX48_002435 [Thoreauomyces humboldtii]|nr:hypothetical protein HKX48_002435 [Thoreauomyces humboldtii]
MPATNGLGKVVCLSTCRHDTRREGNRKSYGDWTNFMIAYGYKPYDLDQVDEAYSLLKQLAIDDENE